ncbi:PssD/Cps14F family polysaccharide biosynthesis glycosyltransferase [Cyclobacterium jeungdonense]|uniref:PssD/Cps14F family polysaccharide biosynthesis glycosyltransferase n=1 Tax=Cyclobacterium jeungdonense TaxID=708087 RepID=A0ABT8C191_9BACT|nr:PssD/Cps14F family polysaccharide biosynthesis glycosyltransferase [Cyclobacterium jeungdonense]MDN3686558.1 PssD/Cps14F family polysaccharide biosynthesis glycosyltransferase [Cyclobacterium jeungdonense]
MKNSDKKKRIILICSDGGHLAQIMELKDWFVKYDYLIVTEKSPSTLPYAQHLNMKFLKGRPKGRKRNLNFFFHLLVNFFLTIKILLGHFPKAIITTGSHTAVPMCLIGKSLGVKVVWILSYARIKSRAASADLIYPIADKFIIQWPEPQKFYKKAIYLGGIY